jgi:hypothetical protein
MALPTVLLLSTVMMMMIGTLFFRTRSQRTILPRINLQTKALALSKGVMQLALYKVKVLPAEFYRANALLKSSGVDPDDTENDINQFFAHWMSDFDDQIATSPVQQMIQRLPDRGKHTYRAGVAVFSIQKSKDAGFKKDLVRITSWASCDEEKKTFESLIEVDIPEITP